VLENSWLDLRFARRSVATNLAFSSAVVLTIALGIGANTAMFSVIHAVLLKPLAYPKPEEVVLITDGSTPIRYQEMKNATRSYTQVGAFAGLFENLALSGTGEPEVLKGSRVSANFLEILGVHPLRGRSFLREEDEPGSAPVAMISAELWRRRFGQDPGIIGKTVTLASVPYTIVGVLSAGFQFPLSGTDVWIPQPGEWSGFSAQSRPISPFLSVFGRLNPGVSIKQANAELEVFNRQYLKAHPEMLDAKKEGTPNVVPVKEHLVANVRSELWMLFGAVGFVLLIVCANVASLLLARATSRTREFAVRAAIGAGRGRIIGQLLAESLLLASIGGALGVALAAASLSSIRGMTFIELPRSGEIATDGTVLGFALALSLMTGVLFGLVPSLVASKPDLAAVLRGSGEMGSAARPGSLLRTGPRNLLVIGQMALSIVLLIGATLLIESLAHAYRTNPGFQTANLLTMKVTLSPTRYDTDEKKVAFYEQFVDRANSIPGIRSAAVTLTAPMADTWMGAPLQLTSRPRVKLNERPIGIIQDVTPGFFRTMAADLKRGREFTIQDNLRATPVAIINESLAHRFWPEYPNGPSPIGEYILIGSTYQPLEIVGISANLHMGTRDEDPRPLVYMPCTQKPPGSAVLLVRTDGSAHSFANVVRNLVLSIDRDQPISDIATMDDLLESSEGQLRLVMRFLGIFAGAASLLAAIGLYGVISYSVAQRAKEIAIRQALGARRTDILSLVVRQGLALSLAGVVTGLGAAFALTRLLASLLYKVNATDPVTFIAVSLLFVAIALAASYLPARRATGIDPLATLRG
jgi:putative ABC transport system permease protein